MQRTTPWVVTAADARPAGKPDECFYCRVPIGGEHKADCVARRRTVVVRAMIEYVIAVPESFDKELIEFGRNEGSWCSSNMLAELNEIDQRDCLCKFTTFEVVREATAEDEDACGVFAEPQANPPKEPQ